MVLSYPLGPGICSDPGTVDLEYPAGTGATALWYPALQHQVRPARDSETSSIDAPELAEALVPADVYGPPKCARVSFTHGFPGSAFTLQPDGTLRCPANHPLYLQERRPEHNGTLGCFASC